MYIHSLVLGQFTSVPFSDGSFSASVRNQNKKVPLSDVFECLKAKLVQFLTIFVQFSNKSPN